MLLVLSDLHLADTSARRTIDVEALCRTIEECAVRADELPGPGLRVLLLGDIFEVLKSQVWIDRGLRPWEASPDGTNRQHEAAVDSIFERIERCNATFFERWDELTRRFPRLHAVYVPGNHDWPLNHPIGQSARRRLVAALKLEHEPNDLFEATYQDDDHGVLASHGHEHDVFNRTEPGKVAFGDAVIIEVLLMLPTLVAKRMPGLNANDPKLEFLHELDNVRPQSPAAMAVWLMQGSAHLQEQLGSGRTAVEQAVSEVVKRMRELRRARNVTSAWRNSDRWLSALAAAGGFFARLGLLVKVLGRRDAGDESGSYLRAAEKSLAAIDEGGPAERIEFYICGHTHLPEHVGVGNRAGGARVAPMFLNTGTWRRVHRYVPTRGTTPKFVTYDEECSVLVFNQQEREAGAPSYEFRRVARRYPTDG